MRIFLEDTFDSAHWLPNVPEGHKCRNLHGHTYRIRIEVEGQIGETTGWIIDYADLKSEWNKVKILLDHHCLNEIPGLQNSTCELLTHWVWSRMFNHLGDPHLRRLEIRETEHCGAIKEG